MVRKLCLFLAISLPLSVGSAADADTLFDDAGVSDAAPAPDAPPGTAVIIVDTGAGTVTPVPGTLPDQVTADPAGTAAKVYAAIKGGQWRLLIALVLAAIMVIGVKLNARVFGTTDRGKALAVMTLATLGMLSAALAGVIPLGPQLIIGAVTTAFLAVGGRQWLSRLLWPQDGGQQWLEWLKPFLGVTAPPPGMAPPAIASTPSAPRF